MKRIQEIQQQLSVPKTEKGQNYMYRTLYSTLQALLPQLAKHRLVMTLPVEFQPSNGVNYVIGHCIVTDADTGKVLAETTYPTMDSNAMIKGGQGTGAACTYAKKGAIDSLFLLDAENELDLDDHEGLKKAADRNQPKAQATQQTAQATQQTTQGAKPATQSATPAAQSATQTTQGVKAGTRPFGEWALTNAGFLKWAADIKKNGGSIEKGLQANSFTYTPDILARFTDAVADYMVQNGMA